MEMDQNPPNGAAMEMDQNPPNGAPNGLPNGAPDGLLDAVQHAENPPHGALNGAPNGLLNGAPNGLLNGAPNGLLNGAPNGHANAVPHADNDAVVVAPNNGAGGPPVVPENDPLLPWRQLFAAAQGCLAQVDLLNPAWEMSATAAITDCFAVLYAARFHAHPADLLAAHSHRFLAASSAIREAAALWGAASTTLARCAPPLQLQTAMMGQPWNDWIDFMADFDAHVFRARRLLENVTAFAAAAEDAFSVAFQAPADSPGQLPWNTLAVAHVASASDEVVAAQVAVCGLSHCIQQARDVLPQMLPHGH